MSGGSVIAGVRELPGRGKRLQTANAVGRANLGVECPDQLVGVNNYVLEQAEPIIRIPLFVEFLESLPLMFDPRVILEVVYGLPLLVSEFLEIVQASRVLNWIRLLKRPHTHKTTGIPPQRQSPDERLSVCELPQINPDFPDSRARSSYRSMTCRTKWRFSR